MLKSSIVLQDVSIMTVRENKRGIGSAGNCMMATSVVESGQVDKGDLDALWEDGMGQTGVLGVMQLALTGVVRVTDLHTRCVWRPLSLQVRCGRSP